MVEVLSLCNKEMHHGRLDISTDEGRIEIKVNNEDHLLGMRL